MLSPCLIKLCSIYNSKFSFLYKWVRITPQFQCVDQKEKRIQMNRETIIQNIMNNYGKYGITQDMINEVIDAGLEGGMSYDMIYLDTPITIYFWSNSVSASSSINLPIARLPALSLSNARTSILLHGFSFNCFTSQFRIRSGKESCHDSI